VLAAELHLVDRQEGEKQRRKGRKEGRKEEGKKDS
jgi:hypothetical protein